jgi:hypothetical protein
VSPRRTSLGAGLCQSPGCNRGFQTLWPVKIPHPNGPAWGQAEVAYCAHCRDDLRAQHKADDAFNAYLDSPDYDADLADLKAQHSEGEACPRLGDQCCPEHAEEWDQAGEHIDGADK